MCFIRHSEVRRPNTTQSFGARRSQATYSLAVLAVLLMTFLATDLLARNRGLERWLTATNSAVIEKSATGYGAYVPDLPGCVATAKTEAEVTRLIREGIQIYLEEMRLGGAATRLPTSQVDYVHIAETASAA